MEGMAASRARAAGCRRRPPLLLALGGCGDDLQSTTTPAQLNQPYTDTTAYSPKAGDGLPASQVSERAAVMSHQWTANGASVDYLTTTGHLTATDPNGNAEATMSYVAYTVPSRDGSPRPVTFFYNGGPGSSSVWLRLGSFAPTRVATPDPLMTNWPNFPLVDNPESLIATTDMVFIDPPGTGLSEAIQPNTNQTFWGADADVKVMRDFIRRYLSVNGRGGSPIYLYGESYGTPRTDMLALALESAGVPLTGIVLQSSILNYMAAAGDQAVGTFPSYAQVAAYFNQVSPSPTNLGAYAQRIENFVTAQYAPIVHYATASSPISPDAGTSPRGRRKQAWPPRRSARTSSISTIRSRRPARRRSCPATRSAATTAACRCRTATRASRATTIRPTS